MANRFKLRATPAAKAAIKSLRGRAKDEYESLKPALEAQGCRVAGYRLLAADGGGYSHYCCKHLADNWRLITTFEPGIVSVEAVGEHDGDAFYESLSSDLGMSATGQKRDQKPECCGDQGWPSIGPTREQRRAAAQQKRLAARAGPR